MQSVIEPFSSADPSSLVGIWKAALGPEWLISEEIFSGVCCSRDPERSVNLLFKRENEILGFVASQQGGDQSAGIVAICVRPEVQRKGIGTTLLNTCLNEWRNRGVQKLILGSGGSAYFWPGVPKSMQPAFSFFRKSGWKFGEEFYDMVAELEGISESELRAFLKNDTQLLRPDQAQVLLAFVGQHFPYWLEAYQRDIARGDYQNIIAAFSPTGEITGAVVLFINQANQFAGGLVWREIFGEKMGGFAALGVAEKHRDQGFGLRLAAHATLELKRRGVSKSFAGWTYLEKLYGTIGYKVWRPYLMSEGFLLSYQDETFEETVRVTGEKSVTAQARKGLIALGGKLPSAQSGRRRR